MLHHPTASQLEALGFHGMAKALAEQINDKARAARKRRVANRCVRPAGGIRPAAAGGSNMPNAPADTGRAKIQ
jgi:hypothetical protein